MGLMYVGFSMTSVKMIFFIEQAKPPLKEDLSASEIQRNEKEYFAHSRSGAEALARKLSERAGLDREFVADSNFWKSQAAEELA